MENMGKTFRDYHLLNVLDSFDLTCPLDVHVGTYFRKNKAIGSKDRKYIAESIYSMIRWMGLIDHHCEGESSWANRYHVLKSLNLKNLTKDSSIPLHIRASFPKALFQYLKEHFGEEKALEFCLASNTKAPTTIRANLLKTTRQSLLKRFQGKYSVHPTKESVFGINFEEKINFAVLEEFKNGLFEVQDEASQMIANLVEATSGDQVLDYCAGSGGKALAFAHKLQGKGQIYLHDIRINSLKTAKKRLKRAGIENAQILTPEAKYLRQLEKSMDWVLVDAPCSGTGTLRRNPDLKWKFSEEMLQRITKEQREIFAHALKFLKPSGTIVYATCSVLPQENEKQVEFFEKNYSLQLTSRPLKTFPTEGGMDGFFGASFKRLDLNP